MIVDTHCHLDDKSFEQDLEEVLVRAKNGGIEKIVIPGADIKDLSRAAKIANAHENIYFAAGVHPYHCDDFDIKILREFSKDKKCVAIGECGLDYYRIKDDCANEDEVREYKKIQKDVFSAQIELAIEVKKPLIVHIRDANEDSFKLLKEHAKYLVGGILHCFNSSPMLLELQNYGFYYGIGGVLTFKNAKALKEILPKIDKDKLLIETDSPYLTPEPNRGKRNEPFYTTFVAQKMSEILNLSVEEIEKITTSNAQRLFKF